MKYVFCVQSNITFLSSLAVIEKEKIDKRKVIILSSRGFNVSDKDFKTYKLKELWARDDGKNYFIYLKGAIVWILWYLYIFRFNKLKVFVPNTRIFPYYIFSKISFVREFSYIDEGTLYYTNKDQIYDGEIKKNGFILFIISIIKGIKHSNTYFLKGADNTYVFSDKVNTKFERISFLDFKNINWKYSKIIKVEGKSIIIVVDGLSALNFISFEDYSKILKTILQIIAKKYFDRKVYYKLHPAYYYNEVEAVKIRRIFSEPSFMKDIEELLGSEILESYIGDDNVLLLTGFSTLGFLSYLSRNEYVSYLYMYKESNLRLDKIKSLPIEYVNHAFNRSIDK